MDGRSRFLTIEVDNPALSCYRYTMPMTTVLRTHLPVIILLLTLLGGCASAPKQDAVKVFYPEPPAPPRLQFLTSFTGENDIADKKSAFEVFVTGIKESTRRLNKPYGVAVWDSKIYVSDLNQGIVIFDLRNRTYGELQGARGMGKLVQPVNIRIDADGTKYVSDSLRGQVVVFDRNDFFVTAFGAPDQWRPVDAVPYQDELFVADMKNSQVVVVDKKSGAVLRRLGIEGELSERLARPTNLAFDAESHLFVSDAGKFQIVKYDRDGHYLGALGGPGKESGTFARPRGIAVDRDNRLYAVDAAFGNVQVFNKDGNLLLYFGATGAAPGDMDLPSQVVIDYDDVRYLEQYGDPKFQIEHLVIVASQFGRKMINVYGFGRERGKRYPTDAELLEQLKARLQKTFKEAPSDKQRETDYEKR
jgi:hypothetical protein